MRAAIVVVFLAVVATRQAVGIFFNKIQLKNNQGDVVAETDFFRLGLATALTVGVGSYLGIQARQRELERQRQQRFLGGWNGTPRNYNPYPYQYQRGKRSVEVDNSFVSIEDSVNEAFRVMAATDQNQDRCLERIVCELTRKEPDVKQTLLKPVLTMLKYSSGDSEVEKLKRNLSVAHNVGKNREAGCEAAYECPITSQIMDGLTRMIM